MVTQERLRDEVPSGERTQRMLALGDLERQVKPLFKRFGAGYRRAFFRSFKDLLQGLVNHHFGKKERTHLWLIDLAAQ